MAKKKCPKCSNLHGPRKLICDCGYAFGKTSKANSEMMVVATSPKKKKIKFQLVGAPVEKRQEQEIEEPQIEEIQEFKSFRTRHILTPAGCPPFIPKGYAGTCQKPCYRMENPWPNGQPDDEDIIDWANKIISSAEENETYSLDAILYFARNYFWEYNTPEYERVKEIICRIWSPIQNVGR